MAGLNLAGGCRTGGMVPRGKNRSKSKKNSLTPRKRPITLCVSPVVGGNERREAMTTNHGERPGVEPADVFDGPLPLYPVAALVGDEACESCGAKVDATGFAFDIGGGCAYACAACGKRSIASGQAVRS